MFYVITGSGKLDSNNELPGGLDDFSNPVHHTRADILERFGETPDLNLDKATCKTVQVLKSWSGHGYFYQTLLVKAKFEQQAADEAAKYGKTLASGYWEEQNVLREYYDTKKKLTKLAKHFLNNVKGKDKKEYA